MVQKRRISEKDWDLVAEHITKQLSKRKLDPYRKKHEKIWKEVDRQVYMEPMSRIANNPNAQNDWRSALELGELSRASEILTADVRRLVFPNNKAWMEPHSKLPPMVDEQTGDQIIDVKEQRRIDGQVRAMMMQQHKDFGLKGRCDLSIKESLHHGGYVVEVEDETMLGAMPNGGVKEMRSPVWVPHSMWNCYPDSSVNTKATNLFYPGNMIIVDSKSATEIKRFKGQGWIPKQLAKIEAPRNNKDVEMIKWYGDIVIPRKSGDIYLPNVKVIVADKKVVFYKPNELPYSRIIYAGYERLDVRDPYYISPLVKMSPTQKLASIMANDLVDSVDLKVKPPVAYDKYDDDIVARGGVEMSPGAQNPSGNPGAVAKIDVGDPSAALAATQFYQGELQKNLGVDAIRSGVSSGTEQTAHEVERVHQGGQLRTVDFVDKHELHGLRPFLYLQHQSNTKNLRNYEFYNPEMDAPDFEMMSVADLPKTVYFDVVGSKGLIEERQRQADTMAVTKFAVEVGAKVNIEEVIKEMYQDAGNKNPERFLMQSEDFQIPPELQAQIEQQMAQLQDQAQALAEENQKLKTQEESRLADAEIKAAQEESRAQNEQERIQLQSELEKSKVESQTEVQKYKIDSELQLEREKLELQLEAKQREQIDMFKEESEEKEINELKSKLEEIRKEEEKREKDRKQTSKAVIAYLRKKDNPELNKVLDKVES